MDLSGGGELDVVDLRGAAPGFFKRTLDRGWEPFHAFASLPAVDWSEPNLKFVDLTGDGLADVFFTEDGLFTLYPSLGEAGFDRAEHVRPPWDEEKGPAVVLADGAETIFLADMSGDGLSDLVRVRDGEICYWPNLGYGRFGPKVTMDGAPRFADQERFDPRRIRLADVNGSGTTDVLYIGDGGVLVCFNQSGNAWAAPTRLAVFPTADAMSSVRVTDLLGTGTACLVWSSPLPAEAAAPLRYVDLMGGIKPHLLVNVRNNLGAETRLTYAPSTRFYLHDQANGRPWATRLPFPVQVVERVEAIDWIGRNRAVTRYAYHHGYFDGFEREFRGFGMVEQWDTEEYRTDTAFPDGDALNWDDASWSPPMLTRTWFHTGAFEAALRVARRYAEEYWIEPALRPASRATDLAAMTIPDTVLPAGLDPFEVREAFRSLKGQALRTEVYAEDGSTAAGNPYVVTENNYTIRRIQSIDGNRHAVFFTFPRESLTFHYERNPDDPRVTHDLTLEVDDYGNVVRKVSVGYPRRAGYAPPEPTLSAAAQGMLAYDQERLHIAATGSQYTNAIDDPVNFPDTYRTPLPSASLTAEITGIAPASNRAGITNLFGFDELDTTQWPVFWDGHHDIPYESIPASDVNGSGVPATSPTRRIVEQSVTVYRSDDLTALLPPGQLQSMALPGQAYRAALTPGLLAGIFGALVPAGTLTEGGYVQLAGETGWWMPSGRVDYSPGDADTPAQELAVALAHFFLPRRAVDPFGGISRVTYDAHDLLVANATDPVGNVTAASNDYRVLKPVQVTDPNGNLATVAFDVLGLVVGTAVADATGNLGDSLKGFVADLDEATIVAHIGDPLADPGAILGNATTRLVYDLSAYQRTQGNPQPSPPAVYTLARETNVSDLAANQATKYQHAFAYSDGFGRVIQQKAQVEPGPLVDGGPTVSPRWVGSGWSIFNNKGKPVRRYEPFFTATPAFEFAAQAGVSNVLFYDPPGRVVATLHPDNTWEKTVFDCWSQQSWDGNDTVLSGDLRMDADVGDHFLRLLGSASNAFVSWHDLRIGGTYGATAEALGPAGRRAEGGRACGDADRGASRRAGPHLPDGGRQRSGRPIFQPYRPGCRGQAAGGLRRARPPRLRVRPAISPAVGRLRLHRRHRPGGQPALPQRDGRRRAADPRRREGTADPELGRARACLPLPLRRGAAAYPPVRQHGRGRRDRARAPGLRRGARRREPLRPAGPPLRSGRRGHQQPVRLQGQPRLEHPAAREGVSPVGRLVGAARAGRQRDARDAHVGPGRGGPIAVDRRRSVHVDDDVRRPQPADPGRRAAQRDDEPERAAPVLQRGRIARRLDVWLQQATAPASLLDPSTAGLHAVTGVLYNARRQRAQLTLGNGTVTTYQYDPQTFRLVGLTTTRPSTFAANQQVVQDLSYYYDPVANITRIRDDADTQNVIYFNNQRVEPSNDYTYDPIYRLIRAVGREHLGQTSGALSPPQQVTNDDSSRMGLPQPGDGNAMGTYTETYNYDTVGNILAMIHQVSSGSWTRPYSYSEPSQIAPTETCNRLSTTGVPGDPAGGPYGAKYTYDAHGNMITMPHLPALTWDEQDRLRSTAPPEREFRDRRDDLLRLRRRRAAHPQDDR